MTPDPQPVVALTLALPDLSCGEWWALATGAWYALALVAVRYGALRLFFAAVNDPVRPGQALAFVDTFCLWLTSPVVCAFGLVVGVARSGVVTRAGYYVFYSKAERAKLTPHSRG
jgi:hypothetical protein